MVSCQDFLLLLQPMSTANLITLFNQLSLQNSINSYFFSETCFNLIYTSVLCRHAKVKFLPVVTSKV